MSKSSMRTGYLDTQFDDTMTGNICNSLVSHIIKFILYNKQQIPSTYDNLQRHLTKKQIEIQPKHLGRREILQRAALDNLRCLQSLLDELEIELLEEATEVQQVVIILGCTILTAKQVFKINLPKIHKGHLSTKHPTQRSSLQLYHSLIESKCLSEMLEGPMSVTNMYIFIKKTKGENGTWILKPRFEVPPVGQHIEFNFLSTEGDLVPCTCKGISVYQDECTTTTNHQQLTLQETPALWYQSPVVFKGFTVMLD